jgi:predicted PurR-regulated permease PerM
MAARGRRETRSAHRIIAVIPVNGFNARNMVQKHTTQAVRYDLDRVIRLIVSVATLVAVVSLLRYLSDALIPFVIGLLIAYLLNPLVNFVESRVKSRAIAVLLTVFGGLASVVVVVALMVPVVSVQIVEFREILSQLNENRVSDAQMLSETGENDAKAITFAQKFDALVDSQTDERIRWVLERARGIVTSDAFDLEGQMASLVKNLVPEAWNVVTGAVSFVLGLTGFVVVLLYVVFLLNDFRLVERAWKDQLPPAYRDSVVQFLGEFQLAMGRYFRGQFVVAASVGILFAIGFSLIGLRMGIVLGLMIGALNMVPYLQTVGLIPASLLGILRAVESGSSIWVSLALVLCVFAAVQLIQDAFLTPRILGKTTGLRPAIIMLGLFVWGKVLGLLGLVLAIPLTCLGLAYYRRWVLKMKNVQVVAEESS